MNQLYVFYGSNKVGILKRSADLVFSFQYTDEWLKYENNFTLSLILKLDSKVYSNKDTLSFFENLLPEGDVKNSIEKSQNTSGVYEFLKRFGEDCAGAITITANQNYKEKTGQQQKIEVDINKIYLALDEKRSVVEVIAENNPGYLSLAGAQDKFAGIYVNQKFYLPKDGAPTTHIIKMPIFRSNIKDSVYNEYFCMQLAKKIGFCVPECFVHLGKYPLYIVQRYDRELDSSQKVSRLHQQDLCQAQGLISEFKYELNNGPSIKNNYDVIVNNTSGKKVLESIHTFLDWIAFNLLIGNNDSHSKNISFLLKNGQLEISPMYDLLSTAIYPKLQKQFSFKIGGRTEYSKIGKNEFLKLDAELGLKAGTFQERFQNVHDLISENSSVVATEVIKKYGDQKIITHLCDLFDDRARSFKKQNGLI